LNSERVEQILSKYPPSVQELAIQMFQEQQRERKSKNTEKLSTRGKVLSDDASFHWFLKYYFGHYFGVEFGEQQLELIQAIEGFRLKRKRAPRKVLRALSRGFGKSTILSLAGVIWLMLRGEWKFVILISSTLEAAKDFLRKVTEEVEDNVRLTDDWPELLPAIDKKGQSVSWKDTDIVFAGNFRIIAKGFLNAIRGKRHKQYRPDALIFDDPDEEKDVASESTMQRKYRWFDRAALKLGSQWGIDAIVAYTTISPNCVGETIFNDDVKYSPKEWDKKKFSAIVVRNGKECSSWEAGAPIAQLLEEREKDPITFARERQNEVMAEIDQVFRDTIQTYHFDRSKILPSWKLILAVDLSLGKTETSDYSAIVGVGMEPSGLMWHVYDDIKRRRPDDIMKDLIRALLQFNWTKCVIEDNGNQDHFVEGFKRTLRRFNAASSAEQDEEFGIVSDRKIMIPIEGISNSGDKIKRIKENLQPHIKAGNLKLRNDSPLLFKMLNEFPYQKKDGADALDMAVRTILYDNSFTTYSTEKLKEKGLGQPKNELQKIKRKQWENITRANTERIKKLMGK
jgi:hypothetical protein